jgi:hypothetical protein
MISTYIFTKLKKEKKMSKIIYRKKIKNVKFKFDILYRKYILSFGIDIGANHYNRTISKKGFFTNFFIEIGLLFWTFGFEVNWK